MPEFHAEGAEEDAEGAEKSFNNGCGFRCGELSLS
jgi:hypothetical protein